MENFKDKVVIVTGAASGIGRASALAFAKAGAKVAVSDVQEGEGIKTVKLIQEIGQEAIFIGCDVSKEEEVKHLVRTVVEKWGKLNYAFNNAGIEGKPAPLTDCTTENWNKTIDINLKGIWLCMKYEIPELLKAGGGAIVNCSSVAGLVGFAELPAYVASKHGVVGLTKASAIEYGKRNIRINAVCPGPIQTPMLERFTHGDYSQFEGTNPMGRIGQPEEIAETALWLCSEGSSYINGQALAIDGGDVSH